MSDVAEGWVLWGTSRTAVLAGLKQERLAAFVKRRARNVTVFPPGALDHAARISKRLPDAVVVAFLSGDDTGIVRLVHRGRLRASLTTTGHVATKGQLAQAEGLVESARRLGVRVTGSVVKGAPVPSAVLEVMGTRYEGVAFRSYDALYERRFDVASSEPNDLDYLNVDGNKEPFHVGDELPVASRDAETVALSVDAPATQLLDEMRRLDPKKASAAAREVLERLFKKDRSDLRGDVVREAAASLVSRCLEHLPVMQRRREAKRLANELLRTKDEASRALLGLALRRVGGFEKTVLERALERETDATAARRLYEAFLNLRHELDDRELLRRARSASAIERKGAYALLEQSASGNVLHVLEQLLVSERDASARELLAGVVARLRSDFD